MGRDLLFTASPVHLLSLAFMTASELISQYRHTADTDVRNQLAECFAYKPVLQVRDNYADLNLVFRTEVVELLLSDFSLTDIQLIRTLFREEIKCKKATYRHDNLYQLCFYLYSLGQLEDTFLLYDAKFNGGNMDVGAMLDREAMTVGHKVEEVLEYVKKEFVKSPELEENYPTITEELIGLIEYPDYDSLEDYSKFIKGYFYGHENV